MMQVRQRSRIKKKRIAWIAIPVLCVLPLVIVVINVVPLFCCQAPLANSKRATFDAIVVLGNPAKPDGRPGEMMQQRVLKAVELFRKGKAKSMILTGAAVYNSHIEAEVMANLARSLGVPESVLVIEPNARNTYQNIFHTTEIMLKHRWSSALVVTSPHHVRRVAFILSHYDLDYQVVPSAVPPAAWASQLFLGQWENYLLTRIALTGYSKTYGLTQDQIEKVKSP